MKKRKLILIACVPLFAILIAVLCLYAKITFDFPANKNGLTQLQRATGINISNSCVFVRETGWGDTQMYFRFMSNPHEINQIIKSKQLRKANRFYRKSSFY